MTLPEFITPTMQLHYVRFMMDVIGRGLVMASQVDQEIQSELAQFPQNFVFAMKVFPQGPAFVAQVTAEHQLVLLQNHDIQPDLTIMFKHLQHAFLVFSFQESTAQAFAHNRMIADGDVASAIRLVRCLNKMEALILPKILAKHAVKQYPNDLGLKEKVTSASQIYFKIAQSYLKGNLSHG